jgi:DNA-binding response OmpR family regulator
MSQSSIHPILLVDDDQDLLMLMKAGLETQGYTVLTRTSAPCRSEIEELAPAVVFMDVNLQKDNGAALCSAIKRDGHSAHPPVILISGHGEEELRQEAASSLADGCVMKPFEMHALVDLAEFYTNAAA